MASSKGTKRASSPSGGIAPSSQRVKITATSANAREPSSTKATTASKSAIDASATSLVNSAPAFKGWKPKRTRNGDLNTEARLRMRPHQDPCECTSYVVGAKPRNTCPCQTCSSRVKGPKLQPTCKCRARGRYCTSVWKDCNRANGVLVALFGAKHAKTTRLQPCVLQWFRKEDTKRSKEGLTMYTPQQWLAKIFEKITGRPLGDGHPLDSYGATGLYPLRVSDPWIGGWEDRLVSWRAAPVKDERAGKELLHELFRRAVGLDDEEADIHNHHRQRGWFSFCRDDWVTGQDFNHCVSCRSCRDTVERGYHWTCGKCRVCLNGANKRCPTCDGVSYTFRGYSTGLLYDDDLDEGDDDDDCQDDEDY